MYTSVKLPNGQTAVSFVPEDSKGLAIVHLSVVKRLTEMLPRVHPQEIQTDLLDRLSSSSNLDYLVNTCKDFIAFHETVNLIKEYVPEAEEYNPEA